MEEITKILVAVDFSDYSARTLKYAADLAEKLKAELIVANVINQRDVDATKKIAQQVSSITVAEYLEKQKKDRNELIQKLMEETSCAHLSIKKVLRVGVPFVELVEAVKDERADLVIMGVKGRSNLANVLFGSTAEKIFRHCPVPLLSIRHMDRQ